MTKRTENRSYLTGWVFVSLIALVVAPTFAQDKDESVTVGYSKTHLSRLSSIETSDPNTCVSFDAEYSDALSEKPSAVLDVDMLHRIRGVVSMILDVIPVSDKKYRLEMKTDPTACDALLESGQDLSVFVDGGTGADGLPVLPDQETFGIVE